MFFLISTLAIDPRISLNLSARNSPVPGLFTQIFSVVNLSPFLISFIETIEAYAKSIVGFSSRMGPLLPLEASLTILDALINSLQDYGSIEQTISGPSLFNESVKCLSRIEAPSATEAIQG